MQFTEILGRAKKVRQMYAKFEEAKYGKAWTREQLVQGFVVDVGELVELSMAKSGIRSAENVDAKLAHELADCLWSVCVIASEYNVDLESAFSETMDNLETKLQN